MTEEKKKRKNYNKPENQRRHVNAYHHKSRAALNAAAKALGFKSWGELETAVKNGEVVFPF
jgi:hypothetical protein